MSTTRTEIRAWARENGYTVGDKGTIAGSIVDAFYTAHPDLERPPAPEPKERKPRTKRAKADAEPEAEEPDHPYSLSATAPCGWDEGLAGAIGTVVGTVHAATLDLVLETIREKAQPCACTSSLIELIEAIPR